MRNAWNDWLAPHDAALKVALAEGCTFTQTAKVLKDLFGIKRSRSAVGGRAHRLGILANRKAEKIAEACAKARAARKPPKHPPRPKPKAKPMPATQQFTCAPIGGLRQADIEPLHIALLDLKPNKCRWPYGDGPYSFCGHQQFPGSSYCEVHAALSIRSGTAGERAAHRVTNKQAA